MSNIFNQIFQTSKGRFALFLGIAAIIIGGAALYAFDGRYIPNGKVEVKTLITRAENRILDEFLPSIENEFVPGEIIVKFKNIADADRFTATEEVKNLEGKITDETLNSENLPRLSKNLRDSKVDKAEKWLKKKRVKKSDFDRMVKFSSTELKKLTRQDGLKKTKDLITELNADSNIEYAEPNYVLKAQFIPNDPYYKSKGAWGQNFQDLWGLYKIDAGQAWDFSQGKDVVVAVVDTGVDYTHPDIKDSIWVNPGEAGEKSDNGIDDDNNGFVDDVHGYDVHGLGGKDDHFHGTHVAGTIAAVGNTLGIIGVAPKAKIMIVKGLDFNGSGTTYGLVKAIIYAVDNGASIINASWGGEGFSPRLLIDAVNYAHSKGVVFVASAGNSGEDVGSEYQGFYPANIRNAIAVSAFDHKDEKAFFSNFGVKIDVAAPGGGGEPASKSTDKDAATILSLLTSQSEEDVNSSPLVVGRNYLRLRGTSMAAPHVSGVAALILGLHPEFSPEQVRQAIRRGAEHVFAPGFNMFEGYGRINAAKSLTVSSPLEAHITKPIFQAHNGKQPIEIYGSANGPNFARWRLEYGSGDSPFDWTVIAASDKPVTDALFKTSEDFKDLPNGDYILRLAAENSFSESFEDRLKITIDKDLPDRYERSGMLSAFPNPCIIVPENGDKTCTTTISWTTLNIPQIAIFLEIYKPAKSAKIEKIIETNLQNGTIPVSMISFPNRYAFVLFDCYKDNVCNPYNNPESDDRVLSIIDVTARKAGENILRVEILREGFGINTRSGIITGPSIDCGPDPLFLKNPDNGNDCMSSYPVGRVVNLTAAPEDENSKFIGWRGACSGGEISCGVTMDVDKTIYAQFGSSNVPNFPFNFQSEQVGSQQKPGVKLTWIDKSDNEERFEIERSFFKDNNRSKLTDVGANRTSYIDNTVIGGKTYEYFLRACNSFGCSDENSTGIFIRAPSPTLHKLNVQKLFKDNEGEIVGLDINCGDDCFAEHPKGTEIELLAIPADGFRFAGWSDDCSGINPTCQIKMTKDRTVAGDFKESSQSSLVIMRPINGEILTPGANVDITVDSSGVIDDFNKIQIVLDNKTYKATKSKDGLYYFNWAVPDGFRRSYSIKAQALDKQGGIVSESEIITVHSADPPTISISNPPDNSIVIPKSKVEITVEILPSDAGITQIEFYVNDKRIYKDRKSPYIYKWRVPKDLSAEYQIQVKAFSGLEMAAISGIVTVRSSSKQGKGPILKVTKPGVFFDKGIVVSNPSGINCGEVCENSFPSETDITLTAIPDSGYVFNGWSSFNDECLGNNPVCVFRIASSDTWVMARFSVPNDIPNTPSDVKLDKDLSFFEPPAVITWNDNSTNEKVFEVERTEDFGLTWINVHNNGSNSQIYYDFTIEKNKEYSYRVRACNNDGCSEYVKSNSLGF